MTIRRIIYALTLVTAGFFYVLYPPWISWYLLVLVLLLVPFDLIISLPGMLTKTVLISAPPFLEKDANAVLTITTIHNKSFPVRCLKVKLKVIGDDFDAICNVICAAEADSRSEVAIDTSRTGLTVFDISRLSTVSLLGLFSAPVSIKKRITVLVLPPPVKPANTVALPRGLILKPKPGGGFSEEHDMRKYRQGDPVRSIHWKLSAKHDSLIIREPLVPPQHSRLVHISKWNTANERDMILGHLRWICDYLLKWDLSFYVKFGDEPAIAEVGHEADLIDFLCLVLDKASNKKIASDLMLTRFTWVYHVDTAAGLQGEA